MTLKNLLRSGKLPFLLAFYVGLIDQGLDVYAFNEREIGTAHAAPWRQRTMQVIASLLSRTSRLLDFFRSPLGRQMALTAAMLALAIIVSHVRPEAAVLVAGTTLVELREEKGRLCNEADQILIKAREDNRMDLRKEEEEKFDAIHVDIDKLTARIVREEKQEATRASLEQPANGGRRSEAAQPTQRPAMAGKVTETERVEAFRAWALGGVPDELLTDAQRETARRCGINVDSKRIKLSMGPVLKSASPEDLRAWQAQVDEKRAALTGAQSTTTTGGYTTADATMRALEFALLAYGGMRSVATVLRTDTGGPLPIPTSDDTANKGEIIAENTTYNELEMTFGQLVLDAFKYSSKYIKASVEFLQDTSINPAEFIGNALGIRIARITNDHFTTGSGSQPNGIVTAATSSAVTFSAAAAVTADNLTDLIHSVDPAYRVNGRWMFHDGGLKMIKKVKVLQYSGDTVGVPLWIPGLTSGQPDMILGYPYTVNQSMTTPATSVKSILFGDFSKYLIRDVRDVTLVRLDERFAEFGQVAFLAFSRHDGDLLDAGTHPVKYGTQA
jgi:HK97 family phage major capsid protein